MKRVFAAVAVAAKELTNRARACLLAGVCLLALFALAGMILTVKYWGPVACATALLFFASWAFDKYNAHIPPARKTKIRDTISAAVVSVLAGKLPYQFDPVTAADMAYSVQIIRDGGADVVTVTLLLMEKKLEEINLRLIRRIFQTRLISFCRSPGFAECAYSPAYPLLTVAGAELVGHDLTLHIVYADNGAAVHYLDGLREKQRKAKEQELQKQNSQRLEDGDLL